MAVRRGSDSSFALYDLITSQRITAVIYVTAQLGIAEILVDGPKTADELAEGTGAHLRSLRRLLRCLSAIGICSQTEDQRFELTTIGGYLTRNANPSLKPWALFEGELLRRSWGGLLESIRTGKTATELEGFDDRFARLAQDPEAAQTFDEAMVALTGTVLPSVLSAYDFSGISRLIDVGGGYGQLMIDSPSLSVSEWGGVRSAALRHGRENTRAGRRSGRAVRVHQRKFFRVRPDRGRCPDPEERY
jgi:hypothetical protein